ncbi:DinB family protein [Metasolibacillus meyeri]|uniref:DinB family protein n=1 Tax=Metasolibacillus meyeri TaxID=1071052 RepID=UPI000D309922|nr:DinB family protein [Metasolibacillus meyeri]
MSNNRQQSIENYKQTAINIRQVAESVSEELLTWKPTEQAWSIQEIIGHLLDSNIINSYRLRKIIAEPVTQLVTFAHEDWVTVQQFSNSEIADLLATYDTLTNYNATLLAKLSEEQWQKYGLKQDEPISVAHIIDNFICKHVEKHLTQIERNRSQFNAK